MSVPGPDPLPSRCPAVRFAVPFNLHMMRVRTTG